MHLNSKPAAVPDENRHPTTTEKEAPRTSKAVQDYEQAVRFDPYNADAWFSLAKAQADGYLDRLDNVRRRVAAR